MTHILQYVAGRANLINKLLEHDYKILSPNKCIMYKNTLV